MQSQPLGGRHSATMTRSYSVCRLYHPSHRVTSLEEAEKFFSEVFGRESVSRISIYKKPDPQYASYPIDYCTFTYIAEVFFDSIDPERYVIDGDQRYESISESHLHGLGWAVEGIDDIYKLMVANNIRSTDQANRPADPNICPSASFSTSKLFYTLAEDTGLRYEVYPRSSIRSYDPRNDPSWILQPWSKSDPLGIEFCSHHTVLTCDLARATKLLVKILGGTIIHQGRNEVLETDSTYIALADAIYEFATPTSEDSYAMEDWKRNAPDDTYHALTFKVKDLSQVAAHLAAKGVRLLKQTGTFLVLNPKDSIGIPWGFTTEMVPNDPRTPAWTGRGSLERLALTSRKEQYE